MAGLFVKDHIARQKGVFTLDHLRAAFKRNICEFTERDMLAEGRGNENPAQGFQIVSKLSEVSNPHRIPLPSFNRQRQRLATNGDFDDVLDSLDRQPIAGDLGAVNPNLQIRLANDAVRDNGCRFDRRHLFQPSFNLLPNGINSFQGRPFHFYSHGRTHAGLQHDDTSGDGLELGRGRDTGDCGDPDNLIPDIIGSTNVGPPLPIRPPVRIWNELALRIADKFLSGCVIAKIGRIATDIDDVLRLVVNNVLKHGDRRWVE